MPPTILSTKLHPPLLRQNLVQRQRLLSRLNAAVRDRPGGVILVSAPAGFGKTTLISQWLNDFNIPVTWLVLDDGDNQPERLLTHLVASLQAIEPKIGREIQGMLESADLPASDMGELIGALLVNDLCAAGNEFVLVLDDYHLIDNQAARQVVEFLIEHQPTCLHPVILTRRDPLLPLSLLRGRGQILEIRQRDLRFDLVEAQTFLSKTSSLHLSEEDVQRLNIRTEGWIAGLQLAALSLEESADPAAFIETFAGDDRHVMDYLMDEVLARQPAWMQEFLLKTSILERLCGPLCQALISTPETHRPIDGWSTLEQLEQANLFILPVDERRQWYRYHRLFADLLQHRLSREQPAIIPELHRRAARWFAENNLIPEAIEHALSGTDYDLATWLLLLIADELWLNGQARRLQNWLEAIPARAMDSRPMLYVYRAWMAFFLSWGVEQAEDDLLTAQKILDAALTNSPSQVEGCPALNEDLRQARGLLDMVRTLLALNHQDANLSLVARWATQALQDLSPDNQVWRCHAYLALGMAQSFLGQGECARQNLESARLAAQAAGHLHLTLTVKRNQGLISMLQGELAQAMEAYWQVIRIAGERGYNYLTTVGEAHIELALLLCEQNQIQGAWEHAQKGIEIGEKFGRQPIRVVGNIALAHVHLAQGDTGAALECISQAENLAQSYQMEPLIAVLSGQRAAIQLTAGQAAAAAAWANRLAKDTNDVDKLKIEPPRNWFGIESLTLARVWLSQGQFEMAKQLLGRLLHNTEERGHIGQVIEILILQGRLYQDTGEAERASQAIQRALELAEDRGYLRIFVNEGPPVARLINAAASRGVCPQYAGQLLAAFPQAAPDRAPPTGTPGGELIEALSPREMEVLALIADGLSNQEIARHLVLSLHTIKSHTQNIYSKLGVKNRTQAVARGRSLGFLPDSPKSI